MLSGRQAWTPPEKIPDPCMFHSSVISCCLFFKFNFFKSTTRELNRTPIQAVGFELKQDVKLAKEKKCGYVN